MVLPTQRGYSVSVCTDSDCQEFAVTKGTCVNFPGNLNDLVTTFYNTPGIVCTVYEYVNPPVTIEKAKT
jgi:hypothetical protein